MNYWIGWAADSWGTSWGSVEVEEQPNRYKQPKVSVSGGDKGGKLHLAQLYAKQDIKDVELETKLLKQDDDLIALLGFMISGRVII